MTRRILGGALALLLGAACSAGGEPPGGDVTTGSTGTSGGGGDDLVSCVPGPGACEDGKATICIDGKERAFECDPVQGMECLPDGCKGACSLAELGTGYIGCDYHPTVTANAVRSAYFHFAVAVANASGSPALITVTRGPDTVQTVAVAPKSVQIVPLPWVPELKGGDTNDANFNPDPGPTRLVTAGAYRLRSDVPVTVYQLSPLEYVIEPFPAGCPTLPGESTCNSFSNDASLLLPTNVLTRDYVALSWPAATNSAGLVAITATEDGTEVTLLGAGEFAPGAGIDGTGHGTVSMNRGDVLEVMSVAGAKGGGFQPSTFGADISGTRIQASAPVQVIGGHSCASVPDVTTGFCDHLEEVMFPIEALGTDYLVTFPAAPSGVSPHVIRVAAPVAETTVHFDPPIAPDVKLLPGAPPLELRDVTQDVRITADGALLIAQYMQGSDSVPSKKGDPALSLAIPTAQYRKEYLFVASSTYAESFVNVVAETGATVMLDGATIPLAEFQPIGSSSFSVARHPLSRTDVHSMTAETPFGIVVYGYGDYTSYMYPGGLDLTHITAPPPK